MGISSFGQRLKSARKGAGLTQVELASRVGAYQTKYKNWESNINEPDYETLLKLCDVLGISTDWLLGRDQKPQPYPSEYEKEVHLLREEAKQYGPDSVRRLRKMLPLIFEKPRPKKETKP